MNKTLLKFGSGNSKLAPNIFTFSLPAGYSCPGAKECLSRAVQQPEGNYKLVDGKDTKHRCFAAIDEALKPTVRLARWHNFNLLKSLKSVNSIADLIQDSLPIRNWKYIVRIHVSGDFYNQMYLDAWLLVAKNNPKTLFYAYTKSLPQIGTRLNDIPKNMKIVASFGGKFDHLIPLYKLRFSRVVLSEQEADDLGLKLDHDDSSAYEGKKSFALLIHGTQPAGSLANVAWQALKKIGKAGYHNQKIGRGWNNSPKKTSYVPQLAMAA